MSNLQRFQAQLDRCCKPRQPKRPLTGIEREARDGRATAEDVSAMWRELESLKGEER